MNTERRKDLARAVKALEAAREHLDEARDIIEAAKDDEREYYDNMPESLQGGDKGERASAAADLLDEAYDALEELNIDDLISKLEEASE